MLIEIKILKNYFILKMNVNNFKKKMEENLKYFYLEMKLRNGYTDNKNNL